MQEIRPYIFRPNIVFSGVCLLEITAGISVHIVSIYMLDIIIFNYFCFLFRASAKQSNMAEAAEENFPRGGNVAVGGVKRKHGKKSERDLFKVHII